jgi:hypothetical protein
VLVEYENEGKDDNTLRIFARHPDERD